MICSKCNRDLPENEFSVYVGKRIKQCKECHFQGGAFHKLSMGDNAHKQKHKYCYIRKKKLNEGAIDKWI